MQAPPSATGQAAPMSTPASGTVIMRQNDYIRIAPQAETVRVEPSGKLLPMYWRRQVVGSRSPTRSRWLGAWPVGPTPRTKNTAAVSNTAPQAFPRSGPPCAPRAREPWRIFPDHFPDFGVWSFPIAALDSDRLSLVHSREVTDALLSDRRWSRLFVNHGVDYLGAGCRLD